MPHGKICYLEIPAKTAEASAEFYRSIFKWKVRPRGDGAIAFDDTGGVSGTWVKESDRTPDERTEEPSSNTRSVLRPSSTPFRDPAVWSRSPQSF